MRLVTLFPHFTAVLSRSFSAPIKAGRLPLTQNLVKLSRSLNRSPRTPSLISPFTQLNKIAEFFSQCKFLVTKSITLSATAVHVQVLSRVIFRALPTALPVLYPSEYAVTSYPDCISEPVRIQTAALTDGPSA